MSDTDTMFQEDQRVAAVEANMIAQGIATTEPVQADYFAFDETHRVMLPDGLSYVDHRTLTEGDRRKYLAKVNRDVRIQKVSGDAIMRIATGEEKAALLESAIVGWNLTRAGKPVPFTANNVREFLDKASPKVIDFLHKEISKVNSWLNAEVSVEDIDKEIAALQEARQAKLEEEEGKAGSFGK